MASETHTWNEPPNGLVEAQPGPEREASGNFGQRCADVGRNYSHRLFPTPEYHPSLRKSDAFCGCVTALRLPICGSMSTECCTHHHHPADPHRGNPVYRRILWAVLAINATMFLVELGAGLAAGSASLQADALDFLGDAGNYAVSLFVVGMALRYRAMAALAKGGTMGLFGSWVIGAVIWHAMHGTLPNAFTMGAVGVAALAANAASFALLWAYRGGDANMRSAWICTRNDVFGNLAVLLAALGVFGTGTGWPDIIVAVIMAGLALQGAVVVMRQAMGELRHPLPAAAE
jgi:Co/Zn/Cd efflux system component